MWFKASLVVFLVVGILTGCANKASPVNIPVEPSPTFAPLLTATPIPYVVREYPERQPDGSIALVQEWSDGHYTKQKQTVQAATPTPDRGASSSTGELSLLPELSFGPLVKYFFMGAGLATSVFVLGIIVAFLRRQQDG